uniref:Uncharacterized protein n=1 Tax=Lactuca sativa TaxID=4236 RepID=A0A9R1W679_LACSA|nr:hypothetical protein LSAT_V11C300136410 [Lactuca sativa]
MKIKLILFVKSVGFVDEDVEQSSHENKICSFSGECRTSSNDANSSSMMSTSYVSNFYMSDPLHDIRPDVPEEFKPRTDEYRFGKFQENHNHDLEDTFHLKSTRTVSYSEKEFSVRVSTMKMGATKAYKLK